MINRRGLSNRTLLAAMGLLVVAVFAGKMLSGAKAVASKAADVAQSAAAALKSDSEPPAAAPGTSKSFGPERTIEGTLPAAPGGPEQRVLFIGNSLTYTWAMPQILTGLARASGINLVTAQHAPGGWYLRQHATAPEALKLLDQGGWTAVIIQEQSQTPAFQDEQVKREVDPAVQTLVQHARAASSGVRIVFYGTPANRPGDLRNAASIPQLSTYDGMQDRITATYRRLAREFGGTVAPAGEAWRQVRKSRPDLQLYGDDTHPNQVGAYLIACAFYGALFARSPSGNAYTSGLQPAVAATLQQAAWDAVLAEAVQR